MRLITLLAALAVVSPGLFADLHPKAFPGLPDDAYSPLDPTSLLTSNARLIIPKPYGRAMSFSITHSTKHVNGDLSVTGPAYDGSGSASVTIGSNSAFGHIHSQGKLWILTTDRSGTWLVELPASGVTFNSCGVDGHFPDKSTSEALTASGPVVNAQGNAPSSVIDILVIYNQAFADRYPGDLLETRVNHYTHIANQTMANSDIDLGFRVVGLEFFDYRNDNENGQLLQDMANTLAGNTAAGLVGLAGSRDALGADLVIMFRPHDIETRGNCGIAYYPDNDPNLGVNVVSDGMSSWSVCLDDVMTHEIGHNLGAAHQAEFGGGSFDPRGAAFVRVGQFGTMMGSFGTGRPDRFYGLPIFSNPQVTCGGHVCGSPVDADNTVVMREVIPLVAAYRPSSSALPLPVELVLSQQDSDSDGVIDWDDHFPFDTTEQDDSDLDGAGDNSDAFPADASEQLDTDSDGFGNNADPDDDGDDVNDSSDAFPLDALETSDDDADGTGGNSDAFPDDADEFRDYDSDGTGNNEDFDDDGDGFAELDPLAEDILVISTGNSRILRFDAATGAPRGVEVPPQDSLLTFQSSLAYRPSDHTLLYLGDSSIKRLDLLNREQLGVWVPPYEDDDPLAPQLESGFPTGIATFDNGRRIAVSRMRNTAIALFRGQSQAVNDNILNWTLSEDESPIDIITDGNGTIILGQANRTIYRADALGTQFLGPPGTEWMQDPHRMTLSGDGRLLISDQGRNAVVAIDAADGEFLGDLVLLAEQGYSNPTGIAVTRSGDLLVACADQDAILRFDLDSGDFLGELVASGAFGLSQPHAMIVVPQLLDRLNDDPDRVIRPNAGLWYNPATDGRGFDIEVFGDRLAAIWYTYDQQGLPMWYLAAGDLLGFEFEGPLLSFRMDTEGGVSNQEVGQLSLTFESERSAQMTFNIGADFGGEPLQWLAFDFDPAGADYTGLWGRADGPGWGVSLATQGSRTVAIAFIYDEAGNPRWTISDPVDELSPLSFDMNAVFSDTLCPACSGVPEFEFKPAGTMEMAVPDNADWSSDIQFPPPLNGSWELFSTPIIRFSEQPQRPR